MNNTTALQYIQYSESEENEIESISSYYLNEKLNMAFSTFKIGNEYYFNEF